MDSNKKALLMKEFVRNSTAMIDINHLAKTIREGMNTDVQARDVVISTRYYDAGVFVIDPLYKVRERQETTRDADGVRHTRYWEEQGDEIPNPYEETVKDNNEESRCASLSVKCKKGSAGSRVEKRVKVKKLCLMSWDEHKNEYPRMSGNIIFRQRTLNFAEEYKHNYQYYKGFVETPSSYGSIATEERLDEARRMKEVLERVMAIPPFVCFWDDKYGFLVKREIRMNRIVFAPEDNGLGKFNTIRLPDPLTEMDKEVAQKVKDFEAHLDKRNIEFGEELTAVAMCPERIEGIVEKHGVEGVEKTFEASVVAEGLPEGDVKRKRKVKVVVEK
jgi:hypothetical protein